MKRIKRIISLAAALLSLCLPLSLSAPASASGGRIPYEEAWDLVRRAYELYWNLTRFNFWWNGGVEGLTDLSGRFYRAGDLSPAAETPLVTFCDVKEYAETIYAEDVSDMMWRRNPYLTPYHEWDPYEKYDPSEYAIGNIPCDLPLDTEFPWVHRAGGGAGGMVLMFYMQKSFYEKNVFPTAAEADFEELENGNGKAEFRFTIFEGFKFDGDSNKPGSVRVKFVRTGDGWRIPDCGFVQALCFEYEKSGFTRYYDIDPIMTMRSSVWETVSQEVFDAARESGKLKLDISGVSTGVGYYFRIIEWYGGVYRIVIGLDLNEGNGQTRVIKLDAMFSLNSGGPVLSGGEVFRVLNGAETFTEYDGPVTNTISPRVQLAMDGVITSPSTSDGNAGTVVYCAVCSAVAAAGALLSVRKIKEESR